jgi:hypothetical protein
MADQYLQGTGSPNGVVTAVVGSTYVDTAATGGIIRWTKFTGSGNTGWLADVVSATIGNLLTANQASVETDLTGLSTTNGTVVRTTAWSLQGSASALVTQTSSTSYRLFASIPGSAAANAVIRGGTRTVTLSAAVRPVSGTPTTAFLMLGTSLRNYSSTAVAVAIGVTTVLKFTVTLPADEWPLTAEMSVGAWVNDSTGSGSSYFDALGIWAGAGGDWALPGVPITGTSPVEAQSLTGTGFPEGVVTAPVGSMYTDTAATNGAIRWIKATGSGNTGWKVEYGDTGWRDLSATSLSNGWAYYVSYFRMRRVNQEVHLGMYLDATSATSDTVGTSIIPTGFRTTFQTLIAAPRGTGRDQTNLVNMEPTTLRVVSRIADGNAVYIDTNYPTTDAWPATLPGTAL